MNEYFIAKDYPGAEMRVYCDSASGQHQMWKQLSIIRFFISTTTLNVIHGLRHRCLEKNQYICAERDINLGLGTYGRRIICHMQWEWILKHIQIAGTLLQWLFTW